jgi:hypothetical protein
MPEPANTEEWIRNGWNIASQLLSRLEPDAVGSISSEPTMVVKERFLLFYGLDLTPDRRRELWIITGEFPPAMIDAGATVDERDAVRRFGALYRYNGSQIKVGRTTDLSLPDFVLGQFKHDPRFGEFLEGIGCYLEDMARTFPWEQYGITGKVFL